jgi:hypothetical protein
MSDDCQKDKENCQKEVIKKLYQKYITFPMAVLAIISFFGLKFYIDNAVKTLAKDTIKEANTAIDEAKKTIHEAERAATQASIAADFATDTALTAKKNVKEGMEDINSLKENVVKLYKEKEKIEQSFSSLERNLTGESENLKIRLETKAKFIESMLDPLPSIIEDLTANNNFIDFDNYARTMERAKTTDVINEQNFKENDKYNVTIYYTKKNEPLTVKVIQELRSLGFKVAQQSIDEITSSVPDQPETINVSELKYFDLSKLTTNIITYSENIEENKANQVREILEKNKIGCSLLKREFFVNQYGLPYLDQNNPDIFKKNNAFNLYLLF